MTTNDKKIVDFTSIGVRAYVGRPNGEKAREYFHIDEFDKSSGEFIEVKFPDTTKTISSSFFLGMFGKSIISSGGKEAFNKRFKFFAKEHIINQIDKSVDRALVSMNSAV
jgi:hypothetical protein